MKLLKFRHNLSDFKFLEDMSYYQRVRTVSCRSCKLSDREVRTQDFTIKKKIKKEKKIVGGKYHGSTGGGKTVGECQAKR